jgi:hypothetical protein
VKNKHLGQKKNLQLQSFYLQYFLPEEDGKHTQESWGKEW